MIYYRVDTFPGYTYFIAWNVVLDSDGNCVNEPDMYQINAVKDKLMLKFYASLTEEIIV